MRSFALAVLLLAACSKPSSNPPATSPDPTTEAQPDAEQPPVDDTAGPDRPGLTAAACEGQGGKVVGDIGDGATQKPDYRCPDSGEAPIGSIVAEPGGPMGVEGAVCCK